MNIAIIPARGGSKRIPRKNIRLFLGKPVISYAIETAIASKLFDEIMVSTEDNEIANIAKQYGAKVPFLRSQQNADDYATTTSVLLEVLIEYEKSGRRFDFGCCIYPATPLLTANLLIEGYETLKRQNHDTVFPVLRYTYPIQRSLRIENGKIRFNWPDHKNSRSQELYDAYHDAGQFYWFAIDKFRENKEIWSDNTGALIISDMEAQDIDTPEDWDLAEFKFEFRKNRENSSS